MDFQIVDATPDDVYGIRQVQKTTWLCVYPNQKVGITKEDIEENFAIDETDEGKKRMEERKKWFTDPDKHTWVAKDGTRIVGFCMVSKEDDHNQVQAIYVLPEYQGKGIGRRLLEAAFSWLGGEKDTYVNVVSYNDQALKFYKNNGFLETGKSGIFDEAAKLPSGKNMPETELVKWTNK